MTTAPQFKALTSDTEIYAVRNELAAALHDKPAIQYRRRKGEFAFWDTVEDQARPKFTAKEWLAAREQRKADITYTQFAASSIALQLARVGMIARKQARAS